jgi:hypothetical protein
MNEVEKKMLLNQNRSIAIAHRNSLPMVIKEKKPAIVIRLNPHNLNLAFDFLEKFTGKREGYLHIFSSTEPMLLTSEKDSEICFVIAPTFEELR